MEYISSNIFINQAVHNEDGYGVSYVRSNIIYVIFSNFI